MPQIMGSNEEAGGAPAAAAQSHRRGGKWQEGNWVTSTCLLFLFWFRNVLVQGHCYSKASWSLEDFHWLIKSFRYICGDFNLAQTSGVPWCRGGLHSSEQTPVMQSLSETLTWTWKENVSLKSPCAFSKQPHLSAQSLHACVFLQAHLIHG